MCVCVSVFPLILPLFVPALNHQQKKNDGGGGKEVEGPDSLDTLTRVSADAADEKTKTIARTAFQLKQLIKKKKKGRGVEGKWGEVEHMQ